MLEVEEKKRGMENFTTLNLAYGSFTIFRNVTAAYLLRNYLLKNLELGTRSGKY